MTVSSYSELKTAIANYTHRSDLTGRDDEVIDFFEAKISRRLRLRGMENTATGTFTASDATLALPTGFIEVRSFTYAPATGSLRKLEYITPEQCESLEYSSVAPPQWYTFAGGTFRLYPTPDAAYAYTLRYYKAITPLDSTNTTNFLLTSHPDVYLYGCLVEACLYAGDDPRLNSWKQSLEEAIQELIRHDRRERFVSPVVNFDAELRAFPTSRNIESDGE